MFKFSLATWPVFLAFLLGCVTPASDELPDELGPVDVDADSIVFAVIGDYGLAGDGERAVADMVKSWDPEFIVTTGDNNYGPEDLAGYKHHIGQYYCDYIYNFDVPFDYRCFGRASAEKLNRFFPSPGNHDDDENNFMAAYLDYFTLPGEETFYSFNWGDVAFYSINSLEWADLEEQKAWLAEEIAKSDKTFQIVYFHHAPYTTGDHTNSTRMQWDFYEWGVDVVLSGHDHIYARLSHSEQEGLHYIVNGVGGRKLYTCRDYEGEDVTVHTCYDDNYGAMRCVADSTRMVMEFYSIDNPSSPLDRIVIEK
jgi:tartrate-resistant acid phosphatase type 5